MFGLSRLKQANRRRTTPCGNTGLRRLAGADAGRRFWLAKDLMAVVTLGIAGDGANHLLDFELGASETVETEKGLAERLARRGFAPARGYRLLTVLDGATRLTWPLMIRTSRSSQIRRSKSRVVVTNSPTRIGCRYSVTQTKWYFRS